MKPIKPPQIFYVNRTENGVAGQVPVEGAESQEEADQFVEAQQAAKDAEENRLNPKWRDLPGNVPGSVANQVSGLASAVSHPIETGRGVNQIARGAVMHVLGLNPNDLPDDPDKEDWIGSYKLATDVGKDYSKKYGSWKGFQDYVIQDPAGAFGDISMLAGGAGAGLKVASAGVKAANFARLANVLGKTGNVLGTTAKWTNPLTLATAPATRVSRKLAEAFAEMGMGIKSADRLSGKFGSRHSGSAILDRTSGFTPAQVGDSARLKMNKLEQELDLLGRGRTVNIGPAQDYARGMFLDAAQGVDRDLERGLSRFNDSIHNPPPNFHGDVTPATRDVPAWIAPQQPFEDANRVKRDLMNQISWKNTGPSALAPGAHAKVLASEKGVVGKLLEQMDNIPGVTDLNRQISSLVPVARRAEAMAFEPKLTENIASRIAAKTGALALAVAAAHEFGPAGFLVGLFGQEVLSSPVVRLAAARALNMPSKIPPTVTNLSRYAALSAAKSNIASLGAARSNMVGDDEKSGE